MGILEVLFLNMTMKTLAIFLHYFGHKMWWNKTLLFMRNVGDRSTLPRNYSGQRILKTTYSMEGQKLYPYMLAGFAQ